GTLLYLTRGDGGTGHGALHQVQYTQNSPPQITSDPMDKTVAVGQTATFSVSASGTAPLSYHWRKNSVAIDFATSSSYTTPATTLSDDGAKFDCQVTNAVGSDTSTQATLHVTSNQPPTATITLPPEGTLYAAGDIISYAATATDPQQGDLPASAFTW